MIDLRSFAVLTILAALPACSADHGEPPGAARTEASDPSDTFNQASSTNVAILSDKHANACYLRESWAFPANDGSAGPCFGLRDAFTARVVNVGWFPFKVLKNTNVYSGPMTAAACLKTNDPVCPIGDASARGVVLASLKVGDFVGLSSAAFNYAATSVKCDDGAECSSSKRGDACRATPTTIDTNTDNPPLRPNVTDGGQLYYWGYGYGRGSLEGTEAGFIAYSGALEFVGFDPTHPCADGSSHSDFEVHGGCDFNFNGTFGDVGDTRTSCTGHRVGGVVQPNPTCGAVNACSEGADDCGSCGGSKEEPISQVAVVIDPRTLKSDFLYHGKRIAQIHKCCLPSSVPNLTGYCITAGNKPAGYDASTQCQSQRNRAYRDAHTIASFGAPLYWAQDSNKRDWIHTYDRVFVHAHTFDSSTSRSPWSFVEVVHASSGAFTPSVTDLDGHELTGDDKARPLCQRTTVVNGAATTVAASCGWVPRVLLQEQGPLEGGCTNDGSCVGRPSGAVCVGAGDDAFCGCHGDGDCIAPQVCDPDGNTCVDPRPVLTSCAADADCPATELCHDGACIPTTPCGSASDCGDAEGGSACVPSAAGGSVCGCNTTADCPEDDLCVNGRCYDAPPPVTCTSDADCVGQATGLRCQQNLCRCTDATTDCAHGDSCNGDHICDYPSGSCDPNAPGSCADNAFGLVCDPATHRCSCATDDQCPSGQTCTGAGICTGAVGSPPIMACGIDSDCAESSDGAACVQNHCGCRVPSDCPDGGGCDAQGDCLPSGVAAPDPTACAGSVDCIGDDLGSACVVKADGTTRCGCTSDAQCIGSRGGHSCNAATLRCGDD